MKRNIHQLVFSILFLCSPAILFSQNADEIIVKHIAAHGGAAKWDQVDAMKITGKYTAFSLEKNFTSYKTKSGCYYSDLYVGVNRVIECFNGNKGWTIDPWIEIPYARNLNYGEQNVFMQKAEFFTPFYNYKEKGYKVEYTGKENVDGTDVFVIKLTKTNGRTETWYLDAKTYLENKCESHWVDFTSVHPCETFFNDFQSVDGLVIPFYVERTFSSRSRMTQIEKVELNPEVDENMFVMPKREEIKKLAFLKGEWNVKLEYWTRRGAWRNFGNTTSHIDFAATNMLQENISYEYGFLTEKTVNYTFNETSGRYRIAEFDDSSSALSIYEGNFQDTTFIVDDTKIHFGDASEQASQHTQYSFSNIDEDSFILERKVSRDKGVTWNPGNKFTYTRKK